MVTEKRQGRWYSSLITHYSSLLWTALALGFLLACDLVLFRNALVDGQIYSRSDTVTYYFPIADSLRDVLREGRLLLWTRHLFGGFPLFADGEAGMLYPPNLAAYLLLSEQEAFIWLRVIRYFLAASFTYCYLRTLRLNRFAATTGALSFTFGSFMVTQMHHSNLANTALWLPLTLCMVELAVRSVGRGRWLYATGAGAAVGIQALGLHVQPLLMSGFFLAVYIPFRVLLCPIAWPAPKAEGPRRVPDLSQLAAAVHPVEWAQPGLEVPCHSPETHPRGVAAWPVRIRAAMAAGLHTLRGWVSRQLRSVGILLLGQGLCEARFKSAAKWSIGQAFRRSRAAKASALREQSPLKGADDPAQFTGLRSFSPTALASGGRRSATLLGWATQGFVLVRQGWHLASQLLAPVSRWTVPLLVGGFHRSVLALLLLGVIPAIAFGIAAVQVIPLVELGFYSFRGPGVSYQFATSYSMPVQSLVNLVFPYFFRYTNRFYWSLWSEWETTLYVGIAPLALAVIALLFVRSRMVLFFAAATVASTLLAFGAYAPYPLYEKLWSLPGFSSLRVPGRFGMLVTFSLAVLAAFGVEWLCRTLRSPETPRGDRWSRLSRALGINGFALYLVGLLSAMAGIVWWLVSYRVWIEREPWAVKRLVEESYLSLRSARPWLTSDMVLSFLNYSLDPTNPTTATSLALMLVVFLLLFCWFAFRRLWRGWATLLVGLVAADMLLFALDFHPTVHINQLSNPDGAARWLVAQNGDGMTRIYSAREVRKTEANKLLPFQVADINGYSSLETVRHQQYMAKLNEFDKALLDLYNVRFVVLPKRSTALPSYEYTSYHPNRPLADGPRANRGAHVTFYVNPPVRADEVAFVSSLRSATDIPQDAEVADLVVVDTQGERVTLKVRAGRDTAEWAWDRPDVTPHVGHQRGRVVDKVWTSDSEGRSYQANLYHGRLKLDKTRTVSRVEFHYTHPKGAVRLYGMMLWENPRTAHQLLASNRFVPRYEDDEVQILENPSRLPRAFLVPAARILQRGQILDTMANGDFDPTKVVLLESPEGSAPRPVPIPDTGVPDPKVVESWLQGNPEGLPGAAEIVDDRATEMEIRISSDRNAVLFVADSYYPGWKVLVDGRPERLYRANYLFRAVLVPEGEHRVRFVFEPESFALGTDISLFTLTSLLILWAVLLPGVPLARWGWRRFKSRRSELL